MRDKINFYYHTMILLILLCIIQIMMWLGWRWYGKSFLHISTIRKIEREMIETISAKNKKYENFVWPPGFISPSEIDKKFDEKYGSIAQRIEHSPAKAKI